MKKRVMLYTKSFKATTSIDMVVPVLSAPISILKNDILYF